MTSQVQHARAERLALADTLDDVGPDAPTLCGQWTAADLAAHLVLREGEPLTAAGILVSALADRTRQAMQRLQRELTYAELVMRVRRGPGRWSPYRIPALDGAANTIEFYIHHEDLRRAQDGWEPRRLSDDFQDVLWKRLRGAGRMLFRRVAVGVLLARPDGGDVVRVRSGEPTAVLAGRPSELVLYAFGRKDAARVELSGPDVAVEALRQANLKV